MTRAHVFSFHAIAIMSALAMLLFVAPVRAQGCPARAGDCRALMDHGAPADRVDIVIFSEGYTMAQRDKFYQDVTSMVDGLFAIEPWHSYAPLINVWALFTPSAESGADVPSTLHRVNTAFDATYEGTLNCERCLVANPRKVDDAFRQRFPFADGRALLVNDTRSGATGGTVVVMDLIDAAETLSHELGHQLGGLADEYGNSGGTPGTDSEPNVADLAHLNPLKWAYWIDPATPVPTPDTSAVTEISPVGAYEGAKYTPMGRFRPAPLCAMAFSAIMCPICREVLTLRYHDLSRMVTDTFPSSPADIRYFDHTNFRVGTVSLPNLQYRWLVDSMPIAGATTERFDFHAATIGLGPGRHTVSVEITDGTPFVRMDPRNLRTETATWNVTISGGPCEAGNCSDCNLLSGCGWCGNRCMEDSRQSECTGTWQATHDSCDACAAAATNCGACIAVNGCGWCEGRCMSETRRAECELDGFWSDAPSECTDCSGRTAMGCGECTGDLFCGWCPSESRCRNAPSGGASPCADFVWNATCP